MEQWMAFLEDKWYFVVIAVIALFIVFKLVKTVIKWLLVIAIIAVIVIYGANYKEKLPELGSMITMEVKDVMVSSLAGEAKDAQYQQNADGTFILTTKRLKIEGTVGSDEITVTFLKQTFKMKIDDAIRQFIVQARVHSQTEV